MQNIVVNMCEKFHNDRLRNDRSLGNGKSDNNNNKNNNNNNNNNKKTFVSLEDPFPDLKTEQIHPLLVLKMPMGLYRNNI